jgi:hypothetical protein
MGIQDPIRRSIFQRNLGFDAICILLLTIAGSASASAIASQEADTDQSSLASPTYLETLKFLRTWEEGPDDDEQLLARLFAIGDDRDSDLKAACRKEDEDTQAKAYLLLRLLGAPGARECAGRLKLEDPIATLAVSDELSEQDYKNLEKLFRARPCEKAMNCTGDDLPHIDESLVYSLILDGSERSMKLVGRMSSLAKASHEE